MRNKNCVACTTSDAFAFITQTVAPLMYRDSAGWLVQQQKSPKGSAATKVLAELLADHIATRYTLGNANAWPTVMLPVPLHWQRELWRGHNQSAALAHCLRSRLHLPLNVGLLKRDRATPSQQTLNRKERAQNLHNAFQITPQGRRFFARHPDACVALIDDVVTTGSTVGELARVLTQAGAREVHVWSPTRAILRV